MPPKQATLAAASDSLSPGPSGLRGAIGRSFTLAILVAMTAPSAAQRPPHSGVPELEPFCGRPQHFDFTYVSPMAHSALGRCRQDGNPVHDAACQVLAGYLELSRGREAEALEALRAGGEGLVTADEPWGEWVSLLLRAEIGHAYGRGREVRSLLAEATALLDRIEASGAPLSERARDLFLEVTGVPASTLEDFEAAGGRVRPLLLRTARASTLALLAYSQSCDADYATARETGRRLFEVTEAGITLHHESRLSEFAAWVDEKRGEADRALQGYALAYRLALERGDPKRIASVALRLSQLMVRSERLDDALAVLKESLENTHSASWPHILLLIEKGIVHARAGQAGASRAALTRAREAARSAGEHRQEVAVLMVGGAQLGLLGFQEEQVALLEETARLLESKGDPESRSLLVKARLMLMYAYAELELRSNMEFQYSEIRRLAAAGTDREILRQAEKLMRAKDPNTSLREVAALYPDSGCIGEELADLVDRLEEAGTVGEQFGIVVDALGSGNPELQELYRRGVLAEDRDFLMRWLERQAESEPTYSPGRPPWQAAEKLAELATTDVIVGKPERARERARQAIASMESYLERMDVDEIVAAMMDEEAHDPLRMAVWALSQVDVGEAFVEAERGRARTLRLALDERPPLRPQPSAEEARVLERIARLEEDEASASPADGSENPELAALRDEFERLRLEARLSPLTAARSPRPPPDLERLQQEILPEDGTLLTYYQVRNKLLIWVVTTDSVDLTQRPMPSSGQITDAVASLRSEGGPCAGAAGTGRGVERIPVDCPSGDPSEELYEWLVAPVEARLRGRHLIIVPTGQLHNVPFAALRNPQTGRYLVEDYSLSLAPAISALAPGRHVNGKSNSGALVMGDSLTSQSPLKGARREVAEIAALLGSEALLGPEASERRVYEDASKARLLHFANHGVYYPARPYFSRLSFTPDEEHDGSLAVHETLDRLDLRGVELVVLSACETALGEVSRGDDVVSLSGSFLVAGSRAVVSTLWRVDDQVSAELMVSFYRHLLRTGISPSEALRVAQLEALTRPRTAAPFFWAGFSITGDLATVLEPLEW